MATQVVKKIHGTLCIRGGGKISPPEHSNFGFPNSNQLATRIVLSFFQNTNASNSENLQRILHDRHKTPTTAQKPEPKSALDHTKYQSDGPITVRVQSDDGILPDKNHGHRVRDELN